MVITNNMTMITMETLIIVMLITMETMITMMKIPLKDHDTQCVLRMVTIAIPLKAMITIAKTTMRGIQELMERLHTGQL